MLRARRRDVSSLAAPYVPRRPEAMALYKVVQDNLSTLYGAVDDGALKIALPKLVRKELEDFLGGVGLNRQKAASACINLELPWNPAVLEQRIGHIYRLGERGGGRCQRWPTSCLRRRSQRG